MALTDVIPRLALYSGTYKMVHSIQVAGPYQFDIGLTSLVTNALGLYPNLAPFLTRNTNTHPDDNYHQHDPELLVAAASMRYEKCLVSGFIY